MKNFLKGKFGTAVILFFTLILAGVAIFTALRLYQLRQEPVAPNVPSSIPRAQEASPPGSCTLSFTLAVSTVSPTPTGTATVTPTATPTGTATATPTGTAEPTATPNPTGTPGVAATPAPRLTPTPTTPTLPVSGTDWPTILGAGIGIFVIIGSLLLAL